MLRIIGWAIARWRSWWGKPVFKGNAVTLRQTDWAERADAESYLATGVWTAPLDTPPPGYVLYEDPGPVPPGEYRILDNDGTELGIGKVFADGQVGLDISDLDVTDVEELRRVYGPAGIIPDAKLVEWAREARESSQRAWEIRSRLEEISRLPVDEPGNDGYRPAAGPTAGTNPKTGVVLPPAATEPTVKEWADLRLEQAYGVIGMPPFPGAAQGFSMRHLNALRIRAARRDPSLSAYDLAILRSRGLV